jgi:predicted Zn-dependent peptidase
MMRSNGWISGIWVVVISLISMIGLGAAVWADVESYPSATLQPYLDRALQQVTEFRLSNGMKFIIYERHEAPVISFLTYADVGGVNEPEGKTGVAHFLEHLAFKGTTRIGTKDARAEKVLLDQLDHVFGRLQQAKSSGQSPEINRLQQEFDRLNQEAAGFVKQNEYGRIVQQEGGVGLNAATSADATVYFYSFPANKLELWMSLESERFLDPVFREFYQEKEVILEERRQRSEDSPLGKMIEAFQAAAFHSHPYKRPVIGYTEDIQNLTRQDIRTFFQTHYVPGKLTMAVVGDVDPIEVKQLAEIYFGRYPAKPILLDKTPSESEQTEPRAVTLKLRSEPWYVEGYHRPASNHEDDPIYDLLDRILSDGRTARLYSSLVESKIGLSAQASASFPGDKYANLFMFYVAVAPGHTLDQVATTLHQELEHLKQDLVTAQELDRVKTQVKADLLETLDSNQGMANLLVEYEVKTGSWRNLFQYLDRIATITAADIQRVAQSTFRPENRTVGQLLSE